MAALRAPGPAVPGMEVATRVRRGSAAPVDEGELPVVGLRVVVEQDVDRLPRRGATPEQRQPDGAVPRVAESLRRDDTDLGLAVRDEAAHAGELGRTCHAQVAVGRLPAEDRVRHRRPPVARGTPSATRTVLRGRLCACGRAVLIEAAEVSGRTTRSG